MPAGHPSLLLGLIGSGIQASLTPAMHEREGAAQGLTTIYRLIDLAELKLDVAALPELLLAAERMGFAGLNITYPAKQAVLPLLDELSEDARDLGAVNTVVLRGGKRIGHNTDWWGYAEAFRRGLPDAARARVVQIGAGGAGSAVAHAALMLGVQQLMIADMEAARAEKVAADLNARFGAGRAVAVTDLAEAVGGADGVINTTPVGMAKLPGTPLDPALLRPSQFVSDVIYFPRETELLRRAREIGCRTLGGGGMAVFQAVRAFELFTGRPADAARMERHFAELSAS